MGVNVPCLALIGGWRDGQILAAKIRKLADQGLAGVDFACRDPEGPMLGQYE